MGPECRLEGQNGRGGLVRHTQFSDGQAANLLRLSFGLDTRDHLPDPLSTPENSAEPA